MSITKLLESTRPDPRSRLGSMLLLLGLMTAAVITGVCPQPVALAGAATTGSRWVPTGNLNVARVDHTATLLPNGKVLVAGGSSTLNNPLASAELYDPASGTWTLTGSMGTPRSRHAATLLVSGKVLVVGGDARTSSSTSGGTGTAELYDPATGTWTSTGSLHGTSPAWKSAPRMQNGKVLVAGGFSSDSVRSAELYDPVTGTWNLTGSLVTARYWQSATLLRDGRVLIARGSDEGDLMTTLASAELYDPIAGTWSETPAPSHAGSVMHTATLLPDGRVLVAGGYGGGVGGGPTFALSELFDPVTQSWSVTGSLASARYDHTATLLPTGEVLVAGGRRTENHFPNLTYIYPESAEIYDPYAGAWTGAGNLGRARSGHTATLLADGRVLVAGGGIGNSAHDSAEVFEGGALERVASPTTIGPGFTGSWFNPAQNGHGFMLEVLPGTPMQLLASWFAFAPQGGQAWIVALGPIDGSRAVLQGIQTAGTGARFPPNFDQANVRAEDWGTLTFTFSDCNHGRVDWAASTPGYGSGGMDLTRLTLPAGLTCPQ
jgi:hypothetical protein